MSLMTTDLLVRPRAASAQRVLVSVASRHGATREIAAVVARHLAHPSRTVRLLPVQQDPDPRDYDAVVLGSAVYDGGWLPAAAEYADRWARQLEGRPTWLFSSGVGAGAPDEAGERVAASIGAIEHVRFGGRVERRLLSWTERCIQPAPVLPDGDLRDLAAVRDWAASISDRLAEVRAAAVGS